MEMVSQLVIYLTYFSNESPLLNSTLSRFTHHIHFPLSTMEYVSLLPVGFRFKPTAQELISHYLKLKINGSNIDVIREVNICAHEPWDLPDMSVVKSIDNEWFFFSPIDGMFPSGRQRFKRATAAGYWKSTGKDMLITSNRHEIGKKKFLVFHTGRAPNGKPTPWVIHEYRSTEPALNGKHPGQRAFVICHLIHKELDEVTETQAGVHGDTGSIRVDDYVDTEDFFLGLDSEKSNVDGTSGSGLNWDDYADIGDFLPSSDINAFFFPQ